ncbi:hypothetical protein ATO12_16030 [Aquimarina atlantica]|uniref:Knr4/Smi1-like domain-containing protein n=1 Tax=Aquimarina atlantica TaxID=1317122 RepID=A0A023BUG3_9FLAO|nr:SMI1/KNR4 family protein [Aquimarina atlantica]EZH73448.1 hypothetical protein ATO12_16030 [Aquimarina atlantica]
MRTNFDVIGERTTIDIDSIKNKVDFTIPKSYLNFIKYYGYGIITEKIEYLNIVLPDKKFFENNFIEDIDLWEWESNSQKNSIQNSILVAHTFDGQHIYCTESSFIILPKFNKPVELYDFDEVIQYYINNYNMNEPITYKTHKGY